MENNENVVTEVTENVEEQATEKLVEGVESTTETEKVEEKLYSQAEVDKLVNEKLDEILPRKIEKAKSKLQREYEKKYGRTETVLNAGLGTNNIEDATRKLAEFYQNNGVNIPEEPKYSERDLNLLANAEANEIINSGYDDIVDEVDRLASIGANNMTQRELLVFQKLATERKRQEAIKELAKVGVNEDSLNDKDYREFSQKLNPNMSEKDKYEMYLKFKPKKEVQPMGSMKNAAKDNEVKEYYSVEEARKFSREDFEKNPALFKAVEASMQKWK